MDLALGAGRNPTGELVANVALGEIDLNLQHIEFMGGMARPYLYGRPKSNPLVRSSLASTRTAFDLAADTAMPLGLSFGLDEWDEGNRHLRLIAHNGLHLTALELDHRLTVTNAFAADGTQTRRSAGQVLLGFDLFGGHHRTVVEYDATPLAQVTNFAMNSEWGFEGGGAAVVGFTHRPLTAVSEARLGFRQPVGGFDMTSDFVADSEGGYVVGIRFSLPLGPAPGRTPWSLSALVSNLHAERQVAAPPDSDSFSLVDSPQ